MLKVHRLSQCPHTTNLLVMLILLENEECKYCKLLSTTVSIYFIV